VQCRKRTRWQRTPIVANRGCCQKQRGKDLLYISNLGNDTVTAYIYPQGGLVGTLTGFDQPDGECVDRVGDVFITNFKGSNILEYPHGSSSPSATISDSGEHPAGCSVDPINGELAVTNSYTFSGEAGSISLYRYNHRRGWSLLQMYSDSTFFYMYFCGYDARGNLFVDGLTGYSGSFIFAELPAGHKTFTHIKLNRNIESPGQVQWDGAHIAVGNQGGDATVYRFRINGNSGRLIGSTPLDHSKSLAQFWIQGRTVVGPILRTAQAQAQARSVSVGTPTRARTVSTQCSTGRRVHGPTARRSRCLRNTTTSFSSTDAAHLLDLLVG
jgi:hypothetical protein